MQFLIAHELSLTWAVFGLGLFLVVFNIWREQRPRTSLEVSIWPTTPFILIGAFVAILAVVHLMTLYGIEKPPR